MVDKTPCLFSALAFYLTLALCVTQKSVNAAATNEDTPSDFNISEISSPKKPQSAMVKENLNLKYALSKRARYKLQAEQSEDFLSVLSYFCLKVGCQHGGLSAPAPPEL